MLPGPLVQKRSNHTLRSTTSSSLSLVMTAGGLGVILSLKTLPSLEMVEEEVRVTILSKLFPGDEMDGDDKGVLKSSVSSCEKAGERASSRAVAKEYSSLVVVGVQVSASPRTSQAILSDAWRSAMVEMHKVTTASCGEACSASFRAWRV